MEAESIANKVGRPIPGSSKTTNGKDICDDQIKEYICEIIESEGLCYGYYKITIVLRRKFNLIMNKHLQETSSKLSLMSQKYFVLNPTP